MNNTILNTPDLSIDNNYLIYPTTDTSNFITSHSIDSNLQEEIKKIIRDELNTKISSTNIHRLKNSIKLKLINANFGDYISELCGTFLKIDDNKVFIDHQ